MEYSSNPHNRTHYVINSCRAVKHGYGHKDNTKLCLAHTNKDKGIVV